MRNLKRVSLVSLVSVALLGTMALPATAAPKTDATDITVQVPAGELTIAIPVASLALDAQEPKVTGGLVDIRTATETLADIEVSNLRGDGLGWESSVTISDLQLLGIGDSPVEGKTISKANVTFESEEESADGAVLSVVDGVVTAVPTAAANNTGKFSTTLTVNIPAEALAGKYTATLTHSVL